MAGIDYLQKFPQSILNRESTSVLGKLWKMHSIQLDAITAQINALKLILEISTQTGINLDNIGDLIKEERDPGQSDADYRIDLIAATKSRVSSGSIPDILDVAKSVHELVTDDTILREEFPARIRIHTNVDRLYQNNSKIIDQSTAAGVALDLSYLSGTAVPFSCNDNSRGGLGFSSTSTITDVTSGSGQFVSIAL
jgi:hypothetical protein